MVQLYLGDSFIYTLDELRSFVKGMNNYESDELLAYYRDGYLIEWLLEGDDESNELGHILEEFSKSEHGNNEVLEKIGEVFEADMSVHAYSFDEHVEYIGSYVSRVFNDNSNHEHQTIKDDEGYIKSRAVYDSSLTDNISFHLKFKILKPENDIISLEYSIKTIAGDIIVKESSIELGLHERKNENVDLEFNLETSILNRQDSVLIISYGNSKIDTIRLLERQLSKHKENDEYLFLVNKYIDNSRSIRVIKKNGDVVNGLDTVLVVDNRLFAYDQSNMPPFILGMSTSDHNLYFISSKQILCLDSWEKGRIDNYNFRNHKFFGNYFVQSRDYEKEVVLEEDLSSFYIQDKFDYKTHFVVEDGLCILETDALKLQTLRGMPYKMAEGDIPISVSTITGEKVHIPGFKANIYLGNHDEQDIFWATKKCSPGQYRFSESYIVDIKGNIIRRYDYHFAYALLGKYILNIHNNVLKSISKLNGDFVIKCNFDISDIDITSITEVEDNIFRFKESYSEDALFWLVEENVFCRKYNEDLYIVEDKHCNEYLYCRKDNHCIGTILRSNLVGSKLPDSIYYVRLEESPSGMFIKANGDPIYKLRDTEFACTIQDQESTNDYQVCGVSENRIVINVENRYYKILDYDAKEIARIDYTGIAECYHWGRLYYYNQYEIGYYDLNGKKHKVSYEASKRIEGICVISSKYIFIDHDNSNVIIDNDGIVVLKGKTVKFYKEPHKYIVVSYETGNDIIYNDNCEELFTTREGEQVLILQ